MITLNVNGERREFEADPDMPLLWALRDILGLKGAKYGCGIGQCGACTIHLDGRTVSSCVVPVKAVRGRAITTIEGLAKDGKLHPVQQAWLDEDVVQCGYCQPGQIMAVADLLRSNPDPSDREINERLDNLCRCGTYLRVRRAIHRAARIMRAEEQ